MAGIVLITGSGTDADKTLVFSFFRAAPIVVALVIQPERTLRHPAANEHSEVSKGYQPIVAHTLTRNSILGRASRARLIRTGQQYRLTFDEHVFINAYPFDSCWHIFEVNMKSGSSGIML